MSIPGLAAQGSCVAGRYYPGVLRAILFDFNGVLVDDEPIHLELFQRVLADEGIALSADDYYARYLGLDDRACFAAVLAAAGEAATVPRLMRLTARKASYYQERVRREGYPFAAGAAGLVRELAARGWMLGVVSGALREEVEGALRQEGLLDRFKALITAEDVERGQAGPEGYERALEALELAAPRCRSACSTRTRCSPSRTARSAWPPPPRWGSRRSASPTPTPTPCCAGRTPWWRASTS